MKVDRSRRARVLHGVVFLAVVVTAAWGAASVGSAAPAATPTPPWGNAPIDRNATLVVAYPFDPGRFDPRLVVTSYHRNVDLSIFDQLVVKNYYDLSKPLTIEPALATSWTLSRDRKTYTFQLRRGVRFHDGTPFNADAVVFTFRTILDPSFEFYCAPCNTASARDNSTIASVRRLGPYRVALTLKEPFGGFIELLSTQTQFAIVSPTAVRANGNAAFNLKPVGTGPMRFVEYQPGQRVVLQRYPGHWRGPTAYKWLVLRLIPDAVARANALQAGEVGIATDIAPSYIAAWKGQSSYRTVIRSSPRQYTCHLNYRGGGPTSKLKVRQALSLAANRGAMNVVIYDKQGSRSTGWYTPGQPAYDATMKPFAFDLARARTLLAEAGYESGLKIRFEIATTFADDPKIIAIWQQDLRKIGVELQATTVDRATWVRDWNRGLPPSPAGLDGLCLQSGQDYAWGISQFAGARGIVPGANYNTGGYNNAQAEAQYDRAAAATNINDYFAALKRANRIVADDLAMIMMIRSLNVNGVASNVDWVSARALQSLWYSARVHKK